MTDDRILEHLDIIRKDCSELKNGLAAVDKTLAVQAEQLKYHIKRTDMLEKRIERFESWRWFFVGLGAITLAVGKFLGWF